MPLTALAPAAAEWILIAWLFVTGAAVGSFLNVVIYRLPAGKSLVRPGSHCPACQHPIRWYDNLPILSWFLLRGRCRDCAARISLRYPTVEAITAGLFVVVGVVEGLSGAANLPLGSRATINGGGLPPLGVAETAALVAYHLLLVCTLLAAALIEYDGHRPPARLFRLALLVGWMAPLACPYLHPIDADLAIFKGSTAAMAGFCDATTGVLLGGLLGAAFWRWPKRRLDLAWGPACVGAFLGWQAVLVLTVTAAVVAVLFSGFRRLWPGVRAAPPTVWLGLASLGWILGWGWIVGHWPALG